MRGASQKVRKNVSFFLLFLPTLWCKERACPKEILSLFQILNIIGTFVRTSKQALKNRNYDKATTKGV
jgi:hypothetical protein